ncbi:MAG: Gfo/Idh/MocA family protein [Chitinophagales bacterium]
MQKKRNTLHRRDFLSLSFAAAGSLWLPIGCSSPSKAIPNSRPPSKKIGVALLGLGYYSSDLLAPALQLTEHCYLAGIITGSPDKIPVWQKQYQIPDEHVYSYDNIDEIANDDAIDVVYVVTPTATHPRFAIAAANAGKHVWCEKPMAMTVSDCQSIIEACEKNKRKLSIGYRMLHEPNTQTLMSYADSKPFGAFTRIDSQAGYRGGVPSGWRATKNMGGGALYDMGVYTVNGMRYATNLYPKRVLSARQYTERPAGFTEVDETTEYVLEFENGLKGYGKTSVGENINLLKVSCEGGSYELSPMQSYSGVQGKRSDGILLNKPILNQQAKQMDDDALAILEEKAVIATGLEGMKDIRIIQAIIASAERKEVVDIEAF